MLKMSVDDDSEVRERERERKPARTVGAVVARRVLEGMMVMIRRYERKSGSGRLSKVWM